MDVVMIDRIQTNLARGIREVREGAMIKKKKASFH